MIQVLKHLFSKQNQMYMGTAMAAVTIYAVGIYVVVHGMQSFLLYGMVIISPVAMGLLRWLVERCFAPSFFNPYVMSLGFIVGDTLFLPPALFLAGLAWQDLPEIGWHRSAWFILACAAIGLVVAVCFRFVDGPRYAKAGVPSALISPTKVWHDWAVMSVVVAGLTWLLIPLCIMGGLSSMRPALVFLLLFAISLVIDAFVIKPDAAKQHPEWDPVRFATI